MTMKSAEVLAIKVDDQKIDDEGVSRGNNVCHNNNKDDRILDLMALIMIE